MYVRVRVKKWKGFFEFFFGWYNRSTSASYIYLFFTFAIR